MTHRAEAKNIAADLFVLPEVDFDELVDLPYGDDIKVIIDDFPPMLVFFYYRCSLKDSDEEFKLRFKNYLTSIAEEHSVELINPESEYANRFKDLDDMLTKHSQHFIPEVYEILATEVFYSAINNDMKN